MKINEEEFAFSSRAISTLMSSVLDKGCCFRFKAPGFSMIPFIRDGDIVTIEPVVEPLQVGDVVAFTNPRTERLTVHRIVRVAEQGYLIKGDNCPEPDGLVSLTRIMGRANKVEHSGKKVRTGLGPERRLIAFLSRSGWLNPLVWAVWVTCKPFRTFKKAHSG